MSHDIVVYQWAEIPVKQKKDVIRLPNIRLYIATQRQSGPVLYCLMPVLRRDGKDPTISLTAGPAFRIRSQDRFGKVVTGKLTESEMSQADPIGNIYKVDPFKDPVHKAIYEGMLIRAEGVTSGPFNTPMWCRKCLTRKHLYPKNNTAVCSDLGIDILDKSRKSPIVKEVWDQMADNALCIGYCQDGFLFDFDTILSGGVVCTPRQYDQSLDIFGVCHKADLKHIIKTQKWQGVLL